MTISTGIQQFDHRHSSHFDYVLNCHGVQGSRYCYKGYDDLYGLYLINCIFSSNPWGEIVDRTQRTEYPFRLHVRNPWQGPLSECDLETTCELTVKQITLQNPAPYYVYWSGGIDSTLVLTSFFKSVPKHDIRVCCSSASLDENPYFFKNFIKNKVEFFDSNLNLPTDGTHITGDCGDTIWATLDESFFSSPAQQHMHQPWQQWFLKSNIGTAWISSASPGQTFMEYCEEFFARSGRPIRTLLEARWWYYLICKTQSKALYKTVGSFANVPDLRLVHFFENPYMDSWSWHNTQNMIKGTDWLSYKWPAKEIIFAFDGNHEYKQYKTKGYSSGLEFYKLIRTMDSNKTPALFITDNNERPILPTEPFFSENLYRELFYDRYKHLFTQTKEKAPLCTGL